MTMWRNYWTVAVRALAKSRTYSIINIVGLAIGMAACILILLYVRYEESYDKWLPTPRTPTSSRPGIRIRQDGEPTFLQMSSYVTKAADQEGFPAGRKRASTCSGTEPVFLKDGQASPTEN